MTRTKEAGGVGMAKIYGPRMTLVSPTGCHRTNLDRAPLAPELSLHHFVDEYRELLIAHVTARVAQPGCDVVSYHFAPVTVRLPDGVEQVESRRSGDAVSQL
jgi:hypothetical protein